MPCRSGYEDERPINLRPELDRVTRLLCGVMKVIEEKEMFTYVTDETFIWWQQHKIEDAKRIAEENKKAKQLRDQAARLIAEAEILEKH